MFSNVSWFDAVIIGLLVLAVVCGAIGLGFGAAAYAEIHSGNGVNHRLKGLENKTSGLSAKATITGSSPTKNDINVEHNAYIGRDLIVNNTAYIRDGIVSASGGASFNASVVLNNGDVVAENGQVISSCSVELGVYNLSSTATDVVRGDVVGMINGHLSNGFTQLHDVVVASTVSTYTLNLGSISLSSTRTVNFFLSSTDILVYQVVVRNEHTQEATTYNTNTLATGVAFAASFTFKAVPYEGDEDRFLVIFTDPTATNVLYMQGVTITDLTYPVVTATASSATGQAINTATLASICIGDFKFAYGYTYYATWTGAGGLLGRAFTATVSGTSWTFTMGTIATLTTDVTGAACFESSTAVISSTASTAYIALTWGGGAGTTAIDTNAASLSGTTWTVPSGTDVSVLSSLSASGSRHVTTALAGGTQYMVTLQASSDLVMGQSYTYTLNTATMQVTQVGTTAPIDFSPDEGYMVSFLANPVFDVVSLGGNATSQDVMICWQTSLVSNSRVFCQTFNLNAGVYVDSSNYAVISAYKPGFFAIGKVNDTAITFLWTAQADNSLKPLRFGVVTLQDDGQPSVHPQSPQQPLGIVYTGGAAGEEVTVLLRGCMTDIDLFPYSTQVDLCLHPDGVKANSYHINGVGQTYQPVCSCSHIADGRIYCDYSFTRSSSSPFYNVV